MKWTLPPAWSAGDTVWPAPERLPLGPLMNYGYVGDVLLPVAIEVPASAQVGTTQIVKAAVSFLVCADICIPEDAKLQIALPVVAGTPASDARWDRPSPQLSPMRPRRRALRPPSPGLVPKAPRVLKLAIAGGPLKGADLSHAYFFSYDPKTLDHAAHQNVERGHRA